MQSNCCQFDLYEGVFTSKKRRYTNCQQPIGEFEKSTKQHIKILKQNMTTLSNILPTYQMVANRLVLSNSLNFCELDCMGGG